MITKNDVQKAFKQLKKRDAFNVTPTQISNSGVVQGKTEEASSYETRCRHVVQKAELRNALGRVSGKFYKTAPVQSRYSYDFANGNDKVVVSISDKFRIGSIEVSKLAKLAKQKNAYIILCDSGLNNAVFATAADAWAAVGGVSHSYKHKSGRYFIPSDTLYESLRQFSVDFN